MIAACWQEPTRLYASTHQTNAFPVGVSEFTPPGSGRAGAHGQILSSTLPAAAFAVPGAQALHAPGRTVRLDDARVLGRTRFTWTPLQTALRRPPEEQSVARRALTRVVGASWDAVSGMQPSAAGPRMATYPLRLVRSYLSSSSRSGSSSSSSAAGGSSSSSSGAGISCGA